VGINSSISASRGLVKPETDITGDGHRQEQTEGLDRQVYGLFADFRYLKASRLLEEALKAGKDARLLHNLGVAYYKMGNFPHAERSLEEALQLEPDRSKSHYLLGLILKDQGHLSQAIALFSRALSCDGNLSQGYLQRGICYFLDGNPEKAQKDLLKALSLEPDSLWPNYNLAIVKLTLNDWEGARRVLEKCIKIDPAHLGNYAQLLVESGKAEVFRELYAQSHRMKNMLSLLGSNLREFLQDCGGDLPEPSRAKLSKIIENQNKLYSDFVSYLSTLKREPIELDIVDVNDIIDGAVFALGKIPPRITLRKRIASRMPEIICDSSLIKEAVLNILLNAVEAIEGRGVIEVEARERDRESVNIIISDDGCGIPNADRAKVFDFGYSTKSFGSGIGLSQAQRTVRMHGGDIDFESEEGKGTAFRIALPINPRVEETLANASLKPVLFEELRDLLIVPDKADGLLL
jgi:signal transduction histidine kinase